MIPLTRKEIYDELKNLGINTHPELKFYLKDYYIYYVSPQINSSLQRKFNSGLKKNWPNESTLHDRFSLLDFFNR